jgi:hypothetical protein
MLIGNQLDATSSTGCYDDARRRDTRIARFQCGCDGVEFFLVYYCRDVDIDVFLFRLFLLRFGAAFVEDPFPDVDGVGQNFMECAYAEDAAGARPITPLIEPRNNRFDPHGSGGGVSKAVKLENQFD